MKVHVNKINFFSVVRNTERVQPTEAVRHFSETNAEADQVFSSDKSCPQAYRHPIPARGPTNNGR